MMDILIIGGSRNMGHLLAVELSQSGHRVTVLNRGLTADQLPEAITRLRADRTIQEGPSLEVPQSLPRQINYAIYQHVCE